MSALLPRDTASFRILLIEDEPAYARLISEQLRVGPGPRWWVETAERLQAGLERLSRGSIDVVLVDLSLPDSRGLETFTSVQASVPHVPVIVLTGCNDDALALEAVRRGAQDYVVKGQVDGWMLGRVLRYAIERKRASEELRQADMHAEQLVAAIPSILIGIDADGAVTRWSKKAEDGFGVSAESVLHRPLTDCPLSWDLAGVLEGIAACRAQEGSVRLKDIPFTRPDKTPGVLGLTITPVRWHAGEPSGFLIVAADVTERRQGEQELSRLAAIVESSDEAIIGKTLDGTVTSWNAGAERIFGYPAHEVKGRSIDVLVPSGLTDEMPGILERIKRGEGGGSGVEQLETMRMRKDGRLIHVSLTISPIRLKDGRIVGASTIARDITERKQLEQLKDEFVSTVSHELRTPLSITREGISLLLDGVVGEVNVRQHKVLSVAKDNIDRLARIISSLLDMSKLEAGKVELRCEPIDAREIVAQVTATFERRAQEKGLALRVRMPAEAVQIYADADKVMQILSNLVGNAIKFTAAGSIELSVTERGHDVEWAVADTGIGIARENLPKVFSKFQQFGRTAGAGEKGTGLGLAIAKELVELHRGTIRVESELGKGTTFSFTLARYTVEAILRGYIRERVIQPTAGREAHASLLWIAVEGPAAVQAQQDLAAYVQEVVQRQFCREGDVAIRIQDQLAVFLANCDVDGAAKVKARLQQAIHEHLTAKRLLGTVTVALATATYPEDGTTDEQLLRRVHQGQIPAPAGTNGTRQAQA
jgi:PAS domain S-box-containing protein